MHFGNGRWTGLRGLAGDRRHTETFPDGTDVVAAGREPQLEWVPVPPPRSAHRAGQGGEWDFCFISVGISGGSAGDSHIVAPLG